MDYGYLIGFDFGSTTSSCLITKAHVFKNRVTGRLELRDTVEVLRTEPEFTPYLKTSPSEIDAILLEKQLHTWLATTHFDSTQVVGGGAILTGLAAESQNAPLIAALVKKICQEAIIATARDPHFESWLAFMGGAQTLSLQHPNKTIINLDIGGGTTNLAVGLHGEVISTGSVFIGARHIQFIPGSYQIQYLTPYGQTALTHLKINKKIGDSLDASEITTLTHLYVEALQALTNNNPAYFDPPKLGPLLQAQWQPFSCQEGILTFTGGVGELIYEFLEKGTWPSTTAYGDLGIDLARAIVRSPLMDWVKDYRPTQKGRATVYGITLCSTEYTGSTLFISENIQLPIDNVPVVAHLADTDSLERFAEALAQAITLSSPVCFYLTVSDNHTSVKMLGEKLSEVLEKLAPRLIHPIILIVPQNFGHVLGCYATQWKKLSVPLIVLDEVPIKDAGFVRIGKLLHQVLPVTFYGFK